MINTLTISKPGSQYDFEILQALPKAYRPTGLELVEHGTVLKLDFIDGFPCRDLTRVMFALEQCWTYGLHDLKIDTDQYFEYCERRAKQQGIEIPKLFLDGVTKVRWVHGDATCMNCIQRHGTGTVKFIDPGQTYGMNCKEIDEAKLLCSYDGLETVMRNLPPISGPIPFKVRRIHYELQWTHYLRMLRHVGHVTKTFALEQMERLCLLLR